MQSTASAVKRAALEHGLEVFQPERLDASAQAHVRGARPDALIVAAYGLLLPATLLGIAPLGALNIHASLLPRWRGAAPIERALLAGDTETGISIMRMDEGLDTGPVLARHRLSISASDDAGSLRDGLAALGAEAIVATLADLEAGRATAQPQPQEGATYARKIRREDARLDWSRPAVELERAVRAFRPSPGAATTLEGEAIKVWRATLVASSTPGKLGRHSPGALLTAHGALEVACGEGSLVIQELQRAGGKRLNAAEFLRGRNLPPGARFE
jgi:methionyl-tRNA formyltransferase